MHNLVRSNTAEIQRGIQVTIVAMAILDQFLLWQYLAITATYRTGEEYHTHTYIHAHSVQCDIMSQVTSWVFNSEIQVESLVFSISSQPNELGSTLCHSGKCALRQSWLGELEDTRPCALPTTLPFWCNVESGTYVTRASVSTKGLRERTQKPNNRESDINSSVYEYHVSLFTCAA